jgi:hypothetical protein
MNIQAASVDLPDHLKEKHVSWVSATSVRSIHVYIHICVYWLERDTSIAVASDSIKIVLRYGLEDRETRVRFPTEVEITVFTTARVAAVRPTQTPFQRVPPSHPPSCTEVKNALSYHLHFSHIFHGVTSGNLTFYWRKICTEFTVRML